MEKIRIVRLWEIVLSRKIYTVVSDAKRKHKLPCIYDGHTRSSNLSNIHEVSFSSPFPFHSTNLHAHFRIILVRVHRFDFRPNNQE